MINNVNWKPVNINDIFNVSYGSKFDLMDMTYNNPTVNFVGRTAKNNGVVAYVDRVDRAPFKAGLITVALGGSIGSSFIQDSDFYTAQNVAVLEPKFDMNNLQKLFICEMIQFEVATKFRAFGRELNVHIKKDFSIGMPVKEDESIDWEYIYIYMQSLENGIKQQIYSNLEVIMNMISKLDTSSWKIFKLEELFDISGTKTTPLDDLKEFGSGKYPYVTTQSTNNGVAGFFNYYTEKGNVLVIDSAVAGFCSYQEENFSASDHVEKLVPKFKLNRYIGLFLASVINSNRYRFSYGRKANQKQIKNLEIKLPVTMENKVDLNYIENFMKGLWGGSLKTSVPYSKITFNTLEWKTFMFSDLFKIERGKITQLNELENGKCPIVSAYGEKQGIQFFGNVEPKYENCITASMNGSGTGYFSYHEDKFEANSDCGVLLPKFKLNKYIGLFLVTIANMSAYRYTYGRKLTIDRLENETIKLPSSEESPDWDYMENFIKNLQYSDLI